MISEKMLFHIYHPLPSHSIINHNLFVFYPCPLGSVLINYLLYLPTLSILKSVVLLSLLCEKTIFAEASQKSIVILTSNFNSHHHYQSKALAIILWYSEWVNGYHKNLAHVKLISLALKIEPFSFSYIE